MARSGVEANYKAMAHTSELWIKNLLQELGFSLEKLMKMYYKTQVTIHIASNPVFYERTKHIEVN